MEMDKSLQTRASGWMKPFEPADTCKWRATRKKHFQLNYFGLLKEFNINRMNTILLLNATIWIQCGKIFESSHGICEILYTMFCTVRVLYGCIRWEMEFGNRWSVFTHSHSKHSLHFSTEKWNKFQQISIAIRFEKSNAFLFTCKSLDTQIFRWFNSILRIKSVQFNKASIFSLLFYLQLFAVGCILWGQHKIGLPRWKWTERQ